MVKQSPPLITYLENKGISLQSLIDSALELFVPHPGVETTEKAIKMLTDEFYEMGCDVNVATLVVAAFRAQEDAEKGLVPGLTVERFMGRPGLVADELIGMAIANYVGGSRAMFEFVRYDQAKPGILKQLPPLTNDAIGALVASAASNVYTLATRTVNKK